MDNQDFLKGLLSFIMETNPESGRCVCSPKNIHHQWYSVLTPSQKEVIQNLCGSVFISEKVNCASELPSEKIKTNIVQGNITHRFNPLWYETCPKCFICSMRAIDQKTLIAHAIKKHFKSRSVEAFHCEERVHKNKKCTYFFMSFNSLMKHYQSHHPMKTDSKIFFPPSDK